MSKTKRALCIGINYITTPTARLYGCIRDSIEMTEFLQDSLGYKREDIVVLRDDMPDAMPTATRIVGELNRLQSLSLLSEEIIIHYSGHGAQIRDNTGDETDSQDECIIPSDYMKSGVISDDMLGMILSGMRCRTLIIMDCCHSATCIDLPYLFYVNPTTNAIEKQIIQSRVGFPSNVIMISGCKDSQTSADAYFKENTGSMGALTNGLLNVQRTLSQKSEYAMRYIPLSTFFVEVNKYVRGQGFEQEICLSASMNVEKEALDQMSFFYAPPIIMNIAPVTQTNTSSVAPTDQTTISPPSYIMSTDGTVTDMCGNRPPEPQQYPSHTTNTATVTIPVPVNSTNTYTISIYEHNRVVDGLNKTIADISKQLIDSKSQLDNANKQYLLLQDTLTLRQREVDSLKKQISDSSAQLDSANKLAIQTQAQLDQLNKKFIESQNAVSTRQREIDGLKKQIGDSTTALETTKKELEALRNSPNVKLADDLKKKVSELEAQKAEADRGRANAERQARIFKPYMDKSLSLQAEMTKQQDTFRAQIGQLQTTVTSLQKSIDALKESHQKELREQAARLGAAAVSMSSSLKPPTPTATPAPAPAPASSSARLPPRRRDIELSEDTPVFEMRDIQVTQVSAPVTHEVNAQASAPVIPPTPTATIESTTPATHEVVAPATHEVVAPVTHEVVAQASAQVTPAPAPVQETNSNLRKRILARRRQ